MSIQVHHHHLQGGLSGTEHWAKYLTQLCNQSYFSVTSTTWHCKSSQCSKGNLFELNSTHWFPNSEAQKRKPVLSTHIELATGTVSKYFILISVTCCTNMYTRVNHMASRKKYVRISPCCPFSRTLLTSETKTSMLEGLQLSFNDHMEISAQLEPWARLEVKLSATCHG